MYPELFELTVGDKKLVFGAYRFFGLLAAGYLLFFATVHFKRYNLPWQKLFLAALAIIAAFFAGSRLLYVILYAPYVIEDPARIVDVSLRNFTLYGGLGLALLAWWYTARKMGLPFLKLTDGLMPHTGIALVIMRWGCFLNGCCYGKVTGVPWGMRMPIFSPAHLGQIYAEGKAAAFIPRAVHPTQLYEMAAALAAALAAWLLLRKGAGSGSATAVFVLVLSLGRFITFFFRDFPAAGDISNGIRGPVVYGAAIIISSLWLKFRDT